MNLQKRLKFALKGENFLEFKLEQVIFQIKKYWKNYTTQHRIFLAIFKELMIKLNQTYKEMGKRNFRLISYLSKIQFKTLVNVKYLKKIGIVVPKIDYELIREEKLPAYSFENTSHYLDDLIIILIKFFEQLVILAEYEDIMLKLSLSFRKINRRINGLKNIIIPDLHQEIKKIKSILEEIERESYVRLKTIKNLINKNNSRV